MTGLARFPKTFPPIPSTPRHYTGKEPLNDMKCKPPFADASQQKIDQLRRAERRNI
jgi:hypothetical protein